MPYDFLKFIFPYFTPRTLSKIQYFQIQLQDISWTFDNLNEIE